MGNNITALTGDETPEPTKGQLACWLFFASYDRDSIPALGEFLRVKASETDWTCTPIDVVHNHALAKKFSVNSFPCVFFQGASKRTLRYDGPLDAPALLDRMRTLARL
jgi:hypothetical protein